MVAMCRREHKMDSAAERKDSKLKSRLTSWCDTLYHIIVAFIMFSFGSFITSLLNNPNDSTENSYNGVVDDLCSPLQCQNDITKGRHPQENADERKECKQIGHAQGVKTDPCCHLDVPNVDSCQDESFITASSYNSESVLASVCLTEEDELLSSNLPLCSIVNVEDASIEHPHVSCVDQRSVTCEGFFENDLDISNSLSNEDISKPGMPCNVEPQHDAIITTDCLQSSDKCIEKACVVKEIESFENDNNYFYEMLDGLENTDTQREPNCTEGVLNVVKNKQLIDYATVTAIENRELIGDDVIVKESESVCLTNNNKVNEDFSHEEVDAPVCLLLVEKDFNKNKYGFTHGNIAEGTFKSDTNVRCQDHIIIERHYCGKEIVNELNCRNCFHCVRESKDGLRLAEEIKSVDDEIDFVSDKTLNEITNEQVTSTATNTVSHVDTDNRSEYNDIHMGQLFSAKHSQVLEPCFVPIANLDTVSIVSVDDYAVVNFMPRFYETTMWQLDKEEATVNKIDIGCHRNECRINTPGNIDEGIRSEPELDGDGFQYLDDNSSCDSAEGIFEHDLDTIYETSDEGTEGDIPSLDSFECPSESTPMTRFTGNQLTSTQQYNNINDNKQTTKSMNSNEGDIRTENVQAENHLTSCSSNFNEHCDSLQIDEDFSNCNSIDTNSTAAVDETNEVDCNRVEGDVTIENRKADCNVLHARVTSGLSNSKRETYSVSLKRTLHVQQSAFKFDGLISDCNETVLSSTEQSDVDSNGEDVKNTNEIPAVANDESDITAGSNRSVILNQGDISTIKYVILNSHTNQSDVNTDQVNHQHLHFTTTSSFESKYSCPSKGFEICNSIDIDVEEQKQNVHSFGKKRSYSTGDINLEPSMEDCELDQSMWMGEDLLTVNDAPRRLHRMGSRLSKSAETIPRRKPRIILSNNFRKQSLRETNLDDLIKSLENVSASQTINQSVSLDTEKADMVRFDRKIKIKRRIIRISKSTTSLLEPDYTTNSIEVDASPSHKHVQPSKSVDHLSELLPCQHHNDDEAVADRHSSIARQRSASNAAEIKKQKDDVIGFTLAGKSDRDSRSEFNATKSLPCLLDDDVAVGAPLAAKPNDFETSIDDILECDIDVLEQDTKDGINVIVTDVDNALADTIGNHDLNRNLVLSGSIESALSSDGGSSAYSGKSRDFELPIRRIKTRHWKDPHLSSGDVTKQRMARSDSQPIIVKQRSHSYKKVSVSSDYIARLPSPIGRPVLTRSSSSSSCRSEHQERYLLEQYDRNRHSHRRSRLSTSDADSDVFSDITDASVSMSSLSRDYQLSPCSSPLPDVIAVRVSSGNIPIELPTQLPEHSTPPFDIQSFDNDDIGQLMMAQAASAVRTRRARRGQRKQINPPADLDSSIVIQGDETTDSGLSVSPKLACTTPVIDSHPQLKESLSEVMKTSPPHPLPVRRYNSFDKSSSNTTDGSSMVALDASMFYRGNHQADAHCTSSNSSARYSADSDLSDSIFFDPSIELSLRKRTSSLRNSFVPTVERLPEETDGTTTDLFQRSSTSELPLTRCANDLCQRKDPITKDSQFSPEFTSCSACFTLYCSLTCRKDHWERHKRVCYLGRVSYYIKAMFRQFSNHPDLNEYLSGIAFKSYSTHGHGFIDVTFTTPAAAKFFLVSKSTSFAENPVYMTLSSLPQYVIDNYPIADIRYDVEHCVFDRELVVNVNVKMDTNVDDEILPSDQQFVRHCRRIPLHASFRHLMPSLIPDATKLSMACETLVFTLPAIPVDQANDKDVRLFHCRQASRGLKKCGIQLKGDYPDAYAKFCVYVERNTTFAPITLYGEVDNKQYKCIVYPEGHHGQFDLDDEAGGGVMV